MNKLTVDEYAVALGLQDSEWLKEQLNNLPGKEADVNAISDIVIDFAVRRQTIAQGNTLITKHYLLVHGGLEAVVLPDRPWWRRLLALLRA